MNFGMLPLPRAHQMPERMGTSPDGSGAVMSETPPKVTPRDRSSAVRHRAVRGSKRACCVYGHLVARSTHCRVPDGSARRGSTVDLLPENWSTPNESRLGYAGLAVNEARRLRSLEHENPG